MTQILIKENTLYETCIEFLHELPITKRFIRSYRYIAKGAATKMTAPYNNHTIHNIPSYDSFFTGTSIDLPDLESVTFTLSRLKFSSTSKNSKVWMLLPGFTMDFTK